MKHVKTKLLAAVIMLVVSAIAMTSVSYAWFTVSTAPQVSDIQMTMTATDNLEIARATDLTTVPSEVTASDTGSDTKWGGTVSFSNDAAAVVDFPATLDGDGNLVTIKYDATGRTAGADVAATAPESMSNGLGYYTADITKGSTTLLEDAKVAAVYGVWLRANTALSVTASVDTTAVQVNGAAPGTLANAIKCTVLSPTSTTTVDLNANEAKLVYIAVYVDGANIYASNVASNLVITGIKVTFSGGLDDFATQHAAA